MWPFLFCVVLYLFALSGLDRMVTGVLAKGLKPRGEFHAYVLWHTVLNQSVALFAGLSEPLLVFAVVKYVTVVWCWIGGALDFIYFMMAGEIPEWGHVWSWMPFNPRTWQFAVYALVWLVGITAVWIWILL